MAVGLNLPQNRSHILPRTSCSESENKTHPETPPKLCRVDQGASERRDSDRVSRETLQNIARSGGKELCSHLEHTRRACELLGPRQQLVREHNRVRPYVLDYIRRHARYVVCPCEKSLVLVKSIVVDGSIISVHVLCWGPSRQER